MTKGKRSGHGSGTGLREIHSKDFTAGACRVRDGTDSIPILREMSRRSTRVRGDIFATPLAAFAYREMWNEFRGSEE